MVSVKIKGGGYRSGVQFGKDLLDDTNRSIAVAVQMSCGAVRDLSEALVDGEELRIVTIFDEEGLKIIRHDAAHIMAQAVKRLHPSIKVTIGPVIEDGFYYDFHSDNMFSCDELGRIESVMQDIVKADLTIKREEWTRNYAKRYFSSIGEDYKLEIIADIADDEPISIYKQGEFVDLCRGPHSPSTGMLCAFKLLKVSGAYWRGDPKRVMLQRIYGTAWSDKEHLDRYLLMLEEAKSRDHRKIGVDMGLFHMQDEARGAIFWHEKGLLVYRLLESYIRRKLEDHGYLEVKTPVIVDNRLWKQSGHWDKFHNNMFVIAQEGEEDLAVKPMNCPGHIQIFKHTIRSYKDLPIRFAEFGLCHRNEPSGSLYGTMRVREFVQDDAHIFCTELQLEDEVAGFCKLLEQVYIELGFHDIVVKFSDRPVMRVGSDEVWDKAENALKVAVDRAGLTYSLNKGEGAFYGPKIEFVLKDCLGRSWQCGTLQLDFILPDRLDASYIGSDAKKHRPIMIHRAIIGTFERFIGIMLEHYKGSLPLWLSPVQVMVVNITDASREYAEEVNSLLKIKGVRSRMDLRNEKISYKIREHSFAKVPFIFVVGNKESANKMVSVRKFGCKDVEVMALGEALEMIKSREEVSCQ